MLSRMPSGGGWPRCVPSSRPWRAPPPRPARPIGTPTRRARTKRPSTTMPAESPTITALAAQLESRAITSEAVTDACLARIDEKNPALNAFITTLADEARRQARDADREIAAGRYRGPLHGVP